MLLILFKNILRSFFILLIPAFAVGSILAIMSLVKIPLDIMTITIASISVGMSVDYSIHFAWRYIKESKSNRRDDIKDLEYSISEKKYIQSAGHAILLLDQQ